MSGYFIERSLNWADDFPLTPDIYIGCGGLLISHYICPMHWATTSILRVNPLKQLVAAPRRVPL